MPKNGRPTEAPKPDEASGSGSCFPGSLRLLTPPRIQGFEASLGEGFRFTSFGANIAGALKATSERAQRILRPSSWESLAGGLSGSFGISFGGSLNISCIGQHETLKQNNFRTPKPDKAKF